VAEGTRLLSGRRRKLTEGSNPSLSAKFDLVWHPCREPNLPFEPEGTEGTTRGEIVRAGEDFSEGDGPSVSEGAPKAQSIPPSPLRFLLQPSLAPMAFGCRRFLDFGWLGRRANG
jgi:hypothetical protein